MLKRRMLRNFIRSFNLLRPCCILPMHVCSTKYHCIKGYLSGAPTPTFFLLPGHGTRTKNRWFVPIFKGGETSFYSVNVRCPLLCRIYLPKCQNGYSYSSEKNITGALLFYPNLLKLIGIQNHFFRID